MDLRQYNRIIRRCSLCGRKIILLDLGGIFPAFSPKDVFCCKCDLIKQKRSKILRVQNQKHRIARR